MRSVGTHRADADARTGSILFLGLFRLLLGLGERRLAYGLLRGFLGLLGGIGLGLLGLGFLPSRAIGIDAFLRGSEGDDRRLA